MPLTGLAGQAFVFKSLTEIESQAMTFHRDRDGFVWIGTYVDGLYRFDGKRLKHDLSAQGFVRSNNILAAILGNAELGLMNNPGGPDRERFEKMIKASERARDLVSQILDFSRQTKIPPLPVGRERILFVDDEPSQTELFSEMLQMGYRMTAETDSQKALALFRRSPDRFDALVTDMTLPRLPGDRLSREILAIRPDFPILLCTGYSDRISRENALEMAIREFARKPVRMADMARYLRAILDPPGN